MRPLICLGHVVLALSCTLQGCGKVGQDSSPNRAPREGVAAPEIEGTDLDGAPVKLSDYRGKVVLLSFYANWCRPCVAQFPHEKELAEKYRDQPFVLLGVNGDGDRQLAKRAAERHEFTWRAVWAGDQGGEIARRYRLEGWPTFFLLDARGLLRHVSHQVDREMEININGLLKEIEPTQ